MVGFHWEASPPLALPGDSEQQGESITSSCCVRALYRLSWGHGAGPYCRRDTALPGALDLPRPTALPGWQRPPSENTARPTCAWPGSGRQHPRTAACPLLVEQVLNPPFLHPLASPAAVPPAPQVTLLHTFEQINICLLFFFFWLILR